jgi:LuxR family maltose regulon positive regulatory protein
LGVLSIIRAAARTFLHPSWMTPVGADQPVGRPRLACGIIRGERTGAAAIVRSGRCGDDPSRGTLTLPTVVPTPQGRTVSSECAVDTGTGRPAPAGNDPLLESKFAVPAAPRVVVSRPRLYDWLSQCLQESLAVVTGPAGSGKTELVASWVRARSHGETVAWVSLEQGDGRPEVFWAYVTEGLRRSGLPLSPAVAFGSADRSFLVRLASEIAGQPQPVVLVLDGVSNLAREKEWADGLDFLLRHADKRLRLVLVGRWDPPLPLHRYRLAGRLGEVRGEDLAFTPDETAHLLAAHGVGSGGSALDAVVRHTEGWAAGVRLAAMALHGRADADSLVDTIHRADSNIAGYFTGEVLPTQPAEVRELLRRTSILDTVTPHLADLLTGRTDGRHTLAELKRENTFVRLVGDRPETYRYHPLFREVLRVGLAEAEPGRVAQLHCQASAWFARAGQVTEAIRHATQAGDWSAAAALAVDDLAVGRLVLTGAVGEPARIFRDMPADAGGPEAAAVAAALALADGEPDLCAEHLARAENLVAAGTRPAGTALSLAIAVLDARLAYAYRDAHRVLDSVRVAEELLAQVPAHLREDRPELAALLLSTKGTAQSWLGSLDAAVVTLTDAAASATDGAHHVQLDCLQHVALIDASRGRLRRATHLATQALSLAETGEPAVTREFAVAHVVLAWTAAERYDLDTAWREVRIVEMCDPDAAGPDGTGPDAAGPDRAAPAPGGLAALGLAVVKSRLLRARGEFRGTLAAIRTAAAESDRGWAWLTRELTLSQARLLVATARSDEALALLGGLDQPLGPDAAVVLASARLADGDPEAARQIVTPVTEAQGVDPPVPVDAWLVLATLAAERGDIDCARQAMEQALRLAAPEAQRRCFHELSARLRRLLRDDEDLAAQFRSLGSTTRTTGPRPRGDSVEPVVVGALSKREMEVLEHLAAMLPTEEIAAKLYVSVNTVKTHIRSILRKLSAARRTEAVRRARSLGLI